MSGCSIDIMQGSGRGKTESKMISSDCEYKIKLSLKAAEKKHEIKPVHKSSCHMQFMQRYWLELKHVRTYEKKNTVTIQQMSGLFPKKK